MKILMHKLSQHIPYLPNSERKAALYIMSNLKDTIEMSISEVAEKSNSSTAAIVRLCKKLDLDGFPELKRELAKEVYSSEPETSPPEIPELDSDSDITAILNVLTAKTISSMNELRAVISPENLEKAIDRILESNFILLAGIGASGLVAADLYHKLTRLGIYSALPSDPDVQIVQARTMHECDTVIFFSYSGETESIIKAAKAATKCGATIISVTRIGGNTLSKLSDIVLNIPDTEELFRHAATSSRICQLLIVDIIYRGLINKSENRIDYLASTWNAVRVR